MKEKEKDEKTEEKKQDEIYREESQELGRICEEQRTLNHPPFPSP